MINTLLVEDDLYIQRHFVERFSEEEDIRIVAAVRDAFEAEGLCGQGGIDLVLMDVLTLHKHSGIAAGKRIREAYPNIKVLIVTSLVDPEVLQQARRGCADSLWYKEMKRCMSEDFTPAQIEILRDFIKGYTYREIAEKFNLSVSGVRYNIAEMVRIGGFKNKEELTTVAIENKLVVTTLDDGETE